MIAGILTRSLFVQIFQEHVRNPSPISHKKTKHRSRPSFLHSYLHSKHNTFRPIISTMTSPRNLFAIFSLLLQSSSMTTAVSAVENDLRQPNLRARRKLITMKEQNDLVNHHHQQKQEPEPEEESLTNKLTSLDQIAISGEIQALQIDEISQLFDNHEYVGFIHFIQDQEDEERRELYLSTPTSSKAGARGILTTKCQMPDGGDDGAVYCNKDGVETCVSYEYLQQHPYNTHGEKGRPGYCYGFLPLETNLQSELSIDHTEFVLALGQSCYRKDENCL